MSQEDAVKADPEAQRRLLDLQEIDTTLAQLAHRRKNLPELAQLDKLAREISALSDERVRAQVDVDDLDRDIAKQEREVDTVRQRLAKDRQRLDEGRLPARELTAIEHEIGALQRRQSDLEDFEIELLERRDQAQATLDGIESRLRAAGQQRDDTERAREAKLGEIAREDAGAPAVEDLGFDVSDEDYAAIVSRVFEEEIGRGEGSNFVIHRTRRARTPDAAATALSCLRNLLARETGAYWTFLVDTGQRIFVGASPERHVSSQDGLVMMNPISGTYRHPAAGPDRDGLLAFLADPKEINELHMVLDEEVKMMAVVADGGGQVVGPYLKEMAHLVHTEYLLAGRSTMDVRGILRETMFAPTVTGSPIENACRVIARHEDRGRAYYGGVLALLDHESTGTPQLDSTILIRTALIEDGEVRVPVGATLVRDSTPLGEVAETEAKASGVLAALGLSHRSPARTSPGRFADDPSVIAALQARNDRLSPFWLADRLNLTMDRPFGGRTCLIVDAEDTFTGMLAHMLRCLGMAVAVVPCSAVPDLRPFDLVVAGPGPGDPTDDGNPRVAALREVIRTRRAEGAPLLGVCLGHQVLARELGLPLHRWPLPAQGLPSDINLFGTPRRVGYYSTFTALASPVYGVEYAADQDGFVHALRGPAYAGVQFHPESVLTEDGPAILTDLIGALLPAATAATP